jgi:hypothetical protein
VVCGQCGHFDGRRTCKRYEMHTWKDLPLRCLGFDPAPHVADRRTGPQRWPTLRADIEAARKLDREFTK